MVIYCIKYVDQRSTSEDINCSYFHFQKTHIFWRSSGCHFSVTSLLSRMNQVNNSKVCLIKFNFNWNRSGGGGVLTVVDTKVQADCGRTVASSHFLYFLAAAGPLIVNRATASIMIWSFIFFLLKKSNLWTVNIQITGQKCKHYFDIFGKTEL